MIKKTISVSICSLLLLTLAVGCGNSKTDKSSSANKITSSHVKTHHQTTSESTQNRSKSTGSSVTSTASHNQSSASSSSSSTNNESSKVDVHNLTEAQAEAWIYHHINADGKETSETVRRPDGFNFPITATNVGHTNPVTNTTDPTGATYFSLVFPAGTSYARITADGVLQFGSGSDQNWQTAATSYDA